MIFFLNVDVSKFKFEQVVYELFFWVLRIVQR